MKQYIVTDDAITFIVGGRPWVLPKTHEQAAEILELYQSDAPESELEQILESATRKAVKFLDGKLELREEDGVEVAYYKGLNVGPAVVRRIVEFQKAKLPVEPLVKFLDRLVQNPSRNSVQQLYSFLENGGFALTPNGTFLGYKGVQENGFSITAGDKTQVIVGVTDDEGHIRNWIGDEVRMLRAAVQDDPNVACSTGAHVGSESYATGFGPRVVMVEVDPADVVSVPHDCSCQKLRCCGYKVVAGYDGRVTAPLATVRDQRVVQDHGTPPEFKAKKDKVAPKSDVGSVIKHKGREYLLVAEDSERRVLQTLKTGKILIQEK